MYWARALALLPALWGFCLDAIDHKGKVPLEKLRLFQLCDRFRESNAYASHQEAKRYRFLFSYP